MAAIPISAGYVRRLTKTTDLGKNKDCNIQTKDDERAKEQQKSLLQSLTSLHKISASCQEQAVRVCIEKHDSS